MLESLSFDRGAGSIVMVFEGGRTEELRRCPFPGCSLYHSTLLVKNCPTTGKSIAGEIERQKEQREKESRAHRAKVAYENERLAGLKNQWRNLMLWFGIVVIGIIYAFQSVIPGWTMLGLGIAWYIVWSGSASRYERKIRKQAHEIGRQVMEGGGP